MTAYERLEKLSAADMVKSTRRRFLGERRRPRSGAAFVAAGLSHGESAKAARRQGPAAVLLAFQNQ